MGQKYLAYFDLLGFSDVIKNNNMASNLKLYSDIQINLQTSISRNILQQVGRHVSNDLSKLNYNSVTFSDSFFMWSNDDSVQSLKDMLLTISHLYWFGAHYQDIFLRGAVTVGEFEYRKYANTINGFAFEHYTAVGTALVHAADLEKAQKWAGCVIHPDVKIKGVQQLQDLLTDNIIIDFPVTYSDGVKDSLCINWLSDDRIYDKKDLKERFLGIGKKLDTEGARKIFSNTEQFVNKVSEAKQFANIGKYFRY